MILGLLLAPVPGYAFDTDPDIVDQSPALHLNGTAVSHYLVDKNYNLWIAGFRKAHRREPNPDEVAAWFELFVAQMALKIQLAREGWLERPDIVATVKWMSRYTLTKSTGPLYATLYDRGPIPPERVQAAFALVDRSIDAFIVRFDDEQAALRELGPTGSVTAYSLSGAAHRSESAVAALHDGPIHWPFHPFEEITADLADATPGQTLGPLRHDLGVYYVIVRDIQAAELIGPTTAAGMERALRTLDDDLVRRRRRTEVLRRGQFLVDRPAVETAVARLLSAPGSDTTIPPDAWAPLAGTVLAVYRLDGEPCHVTAQEFAEHFNHRFVRQKPRTVAELVTGLEDLVVEDCDHLTARQLQLDRAPKFVEDRHNFALNQALAAYEREILSPRVQPTRDELQEYAAARPEAYLAPVEAGGALYIFSDPATADRAFTRLQRGETAAAAALATQEIGSFVVHRDGPPLAPQYPNSVVIASADGSLFGPLIHGGQPSVFLKHATGKRVALSFAVIEPQVRSDYLRAELDDAALALFRDGATAASLQVHFDRAKYGLPPTFVFGAARPALIPNFRSDRAGARTAGTNETTTQKQIIP